MSKLTYIYEIANNYLMYFELYEREIMKKVSRDKIKGNRQGYRISYHDIFRRLVIDRHINTMSRLDRFCIKRFRAGIEIKQLEQMSINSLMIINNRVFDMLNKDDIRGRFLQENTIQIDFEAPNNKPYTKKVGKTAMKAIGFLIK